MLHPDCFYHLYNHANGNENLFREERNYYFFLKKAKLHLLPFMKVYAYCLMPNHFHLLISIRSEAELKLLFANSKSYRTLTEGAQHAFLYGKISKCLANLFSSYTQAVNKVYHRKGSLFMPNFKSNEVCHDPDFCKLVHYIHANPVHHTFVSSISAWKFSSFRSMLDKKETALEREYVLEMFGGEDAFREYHKQYIPPKNSWYDL